MPAEKGETEEDQPEGKAAMALEGGGEGAQPHELKQRRRTPSVTGSDQ